MLTASDIGLTQGVQKKVKILYNECVPYEGSIVQQPVSDGSTNISLKKLSEIHNDFNQTPLNPSKVKDIITKTDTGLMKTDFYLFNPIILGKITNDDRLFIVSGRHRLEALLIIADICGLELEETQVSVSYMTFDSMELLVIAVAAHNTNRTLTKPERDRVMLASKMDGQTPRLSNIKGNVGNKRGCEKFFKQFVYHTILDATPDLNQKDLLPEYTTSKVSTYLWKLLLEDEVTLLQKANNGLWEGLAHTLRAMTKEGKFYKPKKRNILRDIEALEGIAFNIYSNWRG